MAASVRRIGPLLLLIAALCSPGAGETTAMQRQPPPRYGLEPFGQIGGPLNALALDGDYAYLGVGPRLRIVSLADLERPTRVWESADYGQLVRNVAVADGVAYVALGGDGLRVLDVANPAASREIAVVPVESEQLAIAGPWLIDVSFHALRIYDRRDPADLREIGSTALRWRVAGLTAHGRWTYLSTTTSGLLAVDIGDPTRPVLHEEPVLPSEVGRLVTHGDRGYVSFRDQERSRSGPSRSQIVVLDLANPSGPTRIAAFEVEGEPSDLAIVDGLLYVSAGELFERERDLLILDVSDPQAPVQVGQMPNLGGLLAQNASDRLAVAWRREGLVVLDVSQPAQPLHVGSYAPTVAGLVMGVTVAGPRAYVCTNRGLWILDLAEPANPRPLGMVPLEGAERVFVRGPYAYVGGKGRGMTIIDVRDPTNPRPVGHYVMRGDINLAGDVAGSHLYIAGMMVGMRVADIADPSQPLEITPPRAINPDYSLGSEYMDAHGYHGVAVAGRHAYVYTGVPQLQIMDVSDPARPRQVGTFELPRGGRDRITALGLAIVGDLAYVMTTGVELVVLSLADPVAPREVAILPIPDIYSMAAPGWYEDITVVGQRAYLATEGGLAVVDIADPTQPRQVSFSPTRAFQAAALGDYVYSASIEHGLQIYRLQGAAGAQPPPAQPAR
jgi:hypothetical protein